MKVITALFFVFICNISIAQVVSQYSSIDKKMIEIPEDLTTSTIGIAQYIISNFKTDADRIRAAFFWTATNISYDVVNMNEPNFIYSPQEKISNALKTKKGVCIHYAEVFTDIANKLGIKTYIIGGYTKQNGIVTPISHAWCGSKVDGKWLLFDPTWASGYVNGQKFVKMFNNNYFKTEPAKMTQSHMPFDYMWQFSSNPLTNNEFFTGITASDKPKTTYDYQSEIAKYELLPDEEKAFEASQRIEKNGVINKLIAEFLSHKKEEFTVLRQNKNVENFNQIIANYNFAAASLNDFIHYRNNKFRPTLSDEEILAMIQNPLHKLKKCKEDIYKIGSVGKENRVGLNSLKNSILQTLKQAEEHEYFVKDYITKNKSQRKSMFSKSSLLGIPLK